MNDRGGMQLPGWRCLQIGLGANLVLVAVKMAAGVVGQSQALIADGLNSMLDVVAGTVSLVGYRIAFRPPDREHHYGHHDAEAVAALIVGLGILATGGVIVRDAVATLWGGTYRSPLPWTALIALGVVVVKLILYYYTKQVSVNTNSVVIRATAADHLADVVASLGVLGGLIGARLGWPFLDPVAAFWVAAVILRNAVRIVRDNSSMLLGAAPPAGTIAQITATLRAVPGVMGLHRTKVRTAGAHLLVDTEVLVDGSLSVDQAHAIANAAGDQVLASHPAVADIVVHVEPHTPRRAAEGADPLIPRTRPGLQREGCP